MSAETTLVLCGGPVNYSNLPVGSASNAMVSVNGKPVIGWILDDLLAKGLCAATVVVRSEDCRLQEFVRRVHAPRMAVALAPLTKPGNILQSVQRGLAASPAPGRLRIVLGDTLLRDSFDIEPDFMYVGQVEESRRWCLVSIDENGVVKAYLDKVESAPAPRMALCGYYDLANGPLFTECVAASLSDGERELSAALQRYGRTRPLRAVEAAEWFDFGHLDTLVHARMRLLQPRYFNSLSIDPVLNTLTKVSDHAEKLRDELEWFLGLPEDLQVLTPRTFGETQSDGSLRMVQEYYGYPTLAELFVYGDLSADTWEAVLRHLFRIHRVFRRYPGNTRAEDVRQVYAEKTWDRLAHLGQLPGWNERLSRDRVLVNGREVRGLCALKPELEQAADALAKSAESRIVHGDFCLSNILFDLGGRIVRLIDPRGSFGRKGIYGDPRYDIAKLRHSFSGLYDFLVAGLFELREDENGFQTAVYANGIHREVGTAFDRMLQEEGYDLREIKQIEGLLFASMLPLHADKPACQTMMWLRSMELLTETLA